MTSIIILVKDDARIEETIKRVMLIPKPGEIEVIVVDASNGRLNYIKDRYPNIKWIDFISKNNKKISIAEQRNIGIRNAKGDIIVFIDAGCLPNKLWLSGLISLILDKKEKIVVGGTRTNRSIWSHNIFAKEKGVKKYLEDASTNNLAIKKEVFKNIGLFDDSFDYGSDIDFGWRATEKGYRIRYVPRAVVTYPFGNLIDEIIRSFRYGSARVKLYKKHSNRIKKIYREEIISVVYPLFIILLPISFIFHYYPLLLIIPLIKNIKYKPLSTVFYHLIYGVGILYGIFRISFSVSQI